jgi:hypothetical protein
MMFDFRIPAFITTTRMAVATCQSGHRIGVTVVDPAFALLYERALQRLANGDWRDAVLDAYTALDMYLPQVPVRARWDRNHSSVPSDLERIMKELKPATRRAENAIGAALAVASVIADGPPPTFRPELARIRNAAVHVGEYPTPQEAEWLILEVERLVREFEAILDAASQGRDPSFLLMMQLNDHNRSFTERVDSTANHSLGTVLGGGHSPPTQARDRIAVYKTDPDFHAPLIER